MCVGVHGCGCCALWLLMLTMVMVMAVMAVLVVVLLTVEAISSDRVLECRAAIITHTTPHQLLQTPPVINESINQARLRLEVERCGCWLVETVSRDKSPLGRI